MAAPETTVVFGYSTALNKSSATSVPTVIRNSQANVTTDESQSVSMVHESRGRYRLRPIH